MLHYKGYTGSVDYSEEDKIFFASSLKFSYSSILFFFACT